MASTICNAGSGYDWLSGKDKVPVHWRADWGCIVNVRPALDFIEESVYLAIALPAYDAAVMVALLALNYYDCTSDDWLDHVIDYCVDDHRENLGEAFTHREEKALKLDLQQEIAELWDIIKRCASKATGNEVVQFQFSRWLDQHHLVIESIYGTSRDKDENNPYRSSDGTIGREPPPVGVARGSIRGFSRSAGLSERPHSAGAFRQSNSDTASVRRVIPV